MVAYALMMEEVKSCLRDSHKFHVIHHGAELLGSYLFHKFFKQKCEFIPYVDMTGGAFMSLDI